MLGTVGARSGLGRARARARTAVENSICHQLKQLYLAKRGWPERSRAVFATLRAHHVAIDELGRELRVQLYVHIVIRGTVNP